MFDQPWPSGYDTRLPSESLWVRVRFVPILAGWPGRFINVRRCGGLSIVLLQLKDPLGVFVKIREFLPVFRGFYTVAI